MTDLQMKWTILIITINYILYQFVHMFPFCSILQHLNGAWFTSESCSTTFSTFINYRVVLVDNIKVMCNLFFFFIDLSQTCTDKIHQKRLRERSNILCWKNFNQNTDWMKNDWQVRYTLHSIGFVGFGSKESVYRNGKSVSFLFLEEIFEFLSGFGTWRYPFRLCQHPRWSGVSFKLMRIMQF